MNTPPSQHHHIIRRPATSTYVQYMEHHGWTQAAGRLTHPVSRWARFFIRQGAFGAASKRFLEDGQGFTAVNGGGRQEKHSFSGGPPWRQRRKKQSREPLLRSEYIRIDGYTYKRGLIVMDYIWLHVRGLFPFYTYILLLLLAEMVRITAEINLKKIISISVLFVC